MKSVSVAVLACWFLAGIVEDVSSSVIPESGLKYLTPEESAALSAEIPEESKNVVVAQNDDNSTVNFGDLIYQHRELHDVLIAREFVVVEALSSEEQLIKWGLKQLDVQKVTSVRVLNFGEDKAIGQRIEVYKDMYYTYVVNVNITVPALKDPRVVIEVYALPPKV